MMTPCPTKTAQSIDAGPTKHALDAQTQHTMTNAGTVKALTTDAETRMAKTLPTAEDTKSADCMKTLRAAHRTTTSDLPRPSPAQRPLQHTGTRVSPMSPESAEAI